MCGLRGGGGKKRFTLYTQQYIYILSITLYLVLNVDCWISLCDQVAHNCPVMLRRRHRRRFCSYLVSIVERFYPLPVVMASLRRAFFVYSGVHCLSCPAF